LDQIKFGKLLQRLAVKKGIESGAEIARLSGISTTTISRLFSGKQKASPETIALLAPHLDVEYEYLLKEAGYIQEWKGDADTGSAVSEIASELARKIEKLDSRDRAAVEALVDVLIREESK
jgi:transcriptional regulator with XRE-family HTH domain